MPHRDRRRRRFRLAQLDVETPESRLAPAVVADFNGSAASFTSSFVTNIRGVGGNEANPARMPEPHRTVSLVHYVDGIIGNGGFQYLFEGRLARVIPTWLSREKPSKPSRRKRPPMHLRRRSPSFRTRPFRKTFRVG
jgi:hypothetical protein